MIIFLHEGRSTFELFLLFQINLFVVLYLLVYGGEHAGEFSLIIGESIKDEIIIENVALAEVIRLIAIHIVVFFQLARSVSAPSLGPLDSGVMVFIIRILSFMFIVIQVVLGAHIDEGPGAQAVV